MPLQFLLRHDEKRSLQSTEKNAEVEVNQKEKMYFSILIKCNFEKRNFLMIDSWHLKCAVDSNILNK